MDPWSYSPDEKGDFFANEFDLPTDSLARNRKFAPEWNQKPSNFMENGVFLSEFADRGFSNTVPRPFQGKSIEFSGDSARKFASACLFASNLLSEENVSASKFPGFPSQELSGIDLRLRSHMDYLNSPDDVFGNDISVIASAPPVKKCRAASSCSQKPMCQVVGCNMDLSSSKDYHKRHRVCEAHSKTSMVIVNGIEQRFCQQCSRFHLLKEFDDRKRSCRKRLAGHNERRRKPAIYFVPGVGHRVFRPSKDKKFQETWSAKDISSIVLPEGHPASLLYRVMDEQNRHVDRFVKSEDECCPRTPIYPANARSSGPNHRYDPLTRKHCHSDPAVSSSEATVVSSSDWELHEVSRSSCALSLLSAQSQHVSGTQSACFSISQTDKNKGPRKDVAAGVHTPRAPPRNKDQMEPLFITWDNNRDFLHGPGSGSCWSYGRGPSAVDLLQLSSHLRRVERQRNSTLVNQERHRLR